MRVRPARVEDAAAILDVVREAAAERRWIATQPEEIRGPEDEAARIRDRDPRRECAFVAEDEGRIVGIAGAGRGARLANAHTADLGITVAASHRGRGVGRALMEAVEGWARAQGVTRMTLGVFAHNARGLRLYERMGYRQEGVRRGHWILRGEAIDEILMAKELS